MTTLLRSLTLAFAVACSAPPPEAPTAVDGERAPRVPAPPATTGGAPVIPANMPQWAQDSPSFVGDPRFYGEASWDDVRGRVLQHQATVGRDRARLAAELGDLDRAARLAEDAVAWLTSHPVATGTGAALHARYLAGARRDAALLSAAAAGRTATVPEGGIGRLRALLINGADADELSAAAAALALPPLDPAHFDDFSDRHALRLALVEAALDAADPFALPDTWGGWDPEERIAERDAIVASATAPDDLPRWARPAWHRRRAPLPARFTVEGLGALPTGDSWVDVGGEPGPAAIGALEVLSLDDPRHRLWLDEQVAILQSDLMSDPGSVPAALDEALSALATYPYTSVYYNQKQARNEVVRQLARAGAYGVAADVVAAAFPLHRQDFACPNRAGILTGLRGRLLGRAGDDRADRVMEQALAAGDAFLAQVDEASRGGGP